MLKNPLLEQLRSEVSVADKAQIEDSFALADRIAFLLGKHAMSQRDLADKLGKRESEISKWLSGSHNFTQYTLTKISLAIGERIYQIPSEKVVHQTVEVDTGVASGHFHSIINRSVNTKGKKDHGYSIYNSVNCPVIRIAKVGSFGSVTKKRRSYRAANITLRDFGKIEKASIS